MTVVAATRIGTLRRKLTAVLNEAFMREHRQGAAALDVRLLLANAIGVDAAGLALRDDDPVNAADEVRATAFVERRIAGEPVARILGRQEFWGLDLEIGPATLVPRPDTETLVEAALGFLDSDGRRDDRLELLDIGTGSGAILLALLTELASAQGAATDCVLEALVVARRNASRFGLNRRARFVATDWAAAIGGQFDLILANPPYIESTAIGNLQIEVRNFDPKLALDGGADGLGPHRAILADLDRLLAPRGRCFLEVGFGQGGIVADMAGRFGFSSRIHRDLAGIDRVIEIAPAVNG